VRSTTQAPEALANPTNGYWKIRESRRIPAPMSQNAHRSCKCGAVYRRTESMASAREINCFQCEICGDILESWNTAWVPNFYLIASPITQHK
jgi:hypothetical protein